MRRANGIEVTALHDPMLGEPRLFLMHLWANDGAGQPAEGLRETPDRLGSRALEESGFPFPAP